MLPVTFNWLDSKGRVKQQTLTTTAVTLADALTNVTAFVALFDPISDAGLQGITITQKSDADDYAATAGSNIDVNGSLQVQGVDGFKYDLNVPMILDSLSIGGGAIDISNAALVSFTNQFLAGGVWRVNNRFPTAISSVIKGQLDK